MYIYICACVTTSAVNVNQGARLSVCGFQYLHPDVTRKPGYFCSHHLQKP
uniref:Uncharacterized protein n=1 Tax=Arion vulgaris TaxID=1028688 RepID=A0A0B6ZU55_9EUPU